MSHDVGLMAAIDFETCFREQYPKLVALGVATCGNREVARELVPKLRQEADIVIGLTHLGVNEDIRLASQVPGIDGSR